MKSKVLSPDASDDLLSINSWFGMMKKTIKEKLKRILILFSMVMAFVK